MALYDRVRALPLVVERYGLDGHQYDVRADFTRKTTVIRLSGAGEEGVGEDVTYDGELQDAQQARGPVLPLDGEWTIESFSRHLEGVALFPEQPERHDYLDYRRWAFESAALDLALRQAGRSLGNVVGHEPRPVTFVASGGLGDPPSTHAFAPSSPSTPRCASSSTRARTGRTRSSPSWASSAASTRSTSRASTRGRSSTTPRTRASTGACSKRSPTRGSGPGAHERDGAGARAARRPRHVGRANPRGFGHRGAPLAPRTVNVKPSRFGSIERLFAAYDHCEAHDIGAYGGGQWELSVGRGHIQLLAALFHPETPNDVAPGGYNAHEPPSGLPTSPMPVAAREPGSSPSAEKWRRGRTLAPAARATPAGSDPDSQGTWAPNAEFPRPWVELPVARRRSRNGWTASSTSTGSHGTSPDSSWHRIG